MTSKAVPPFRALTLAVACALLLALAPGAASAASQSQYASAWAVNNDADWTPYPSHANGANPLGAPNDLCTGSGGAGAGPWADWTFPAFSIPGGEAITGIEVRFKYYATGIPGSPNTAQLKLSGAFVGPLREIPPYNAGMNNCTNTVFQSAGGPGDTWDNVVTAANFNAGQVTVRLTKGSPTLDLDSVQLVVYYGNEPPTAEAGGPYPVNEGGSVGLSAAASTDPDGDSLTFTWDLDGDAIFGEAGETGATPTFSAAGLDGPSAVQVTLRATDPDGASDDDTATVNVLNVAPTVATPTVTPEPSDEGETVSASASFVDPGPDTFTCTVDYGDGGGPVAGTVAANACTGPDHVYGDDGTYTVTVKVTDDDGGFHSASTSHEVENVPPVVAAPTVDVEPSDEGEAVVASATFTDAGTDDSPFTCTVDYGDGSGPAAGTVSNDDTCTGAAHTYADNGSYTVTVAVTDKDGGTGSNSAAHQVDNVDPEIGASTNSAEGCGDTADGEPVEVSADFSDPGFDNPLMPSEEHFDDSTIDWGDGTVEPATVESEVDGSPGTPTTGTISGSHTYASGGIYTVTLTVADDDGGTDSVTVDVFVTGAGVNAGELQVVGTDLKDVVNIQAKDKGDSIEVQAGFLGTPGKLSFDAGTVSSLRVAVCDGDDQVHVNHDVDVGAWLQGGAGRDHLRAGSGPSVLEGEAGDDVLQGGGAPDLLAGGDGDDVLHGRGGDDELFGEAGDDGLHGNEGDDALDGGAGVDDCHGEPGTDTTAGCEP